MMLYADPFKLEAHQLSLVDVVRTIAESTSFYPPATSSSAASITTHLHQQHAVAEPTISIAHRSRW